MFNFFERRFILGENMRKVLIKPWKSARKKSINERVLEDTCQGELKSQISLPSANLWSECHLSKKTCLETSKNISFRELKHVPSFIKYHLSFNLFYPFKITSEWESNTWKYNKTEVFKGYRCPSLCIKWTIKLFPNMLQTKKQNHQHFSKSGFVPNFLSKV